MKTLQDIDLVVVTLMLLGFFVGPEAGFEEAGTPVKAGDPLEVEVEPDPQPPPPSPP